MHSGRNRALVTRLIGAALALAMLPAAAMAQTKGTTRDIKKPPIPEISDYYPAKIYFGRMKGPAPLKPEVFGSYARGCIAGAEQMPADGPAWQVMRPSRDRAWATRS
jgi:penicillin-insensitive murein endopeptidase